MGAKRLTSVKTGTGVTGAPPAPSGVSATDVYCADEGRRKDVRTAPLFGLDFVEVTDADQPETKTTRCRGST